MSEWQENYWDHANNEYAFVVDMITCSESHKNDACGSKNLELLNVVTTIRKKNFSSNLHGHTSVSINDIYIYIKWKYIFQWSVHNFHACCFLNFWIILTMVDLWTLPTLCVYTKTITLQKLVQFPPSGKRGELNLKGLEYGLYTCIFNIVMILTPAKVYEHIKYN